MKNILTSFLRTYLDLPSSQFKVVCLGGGTGMPTLLSGLKHYNVDLTAIVTMADEGGSAGRLRRLLGVPALGDLRRNLAALSDEEEMLVKLLGYRFKGERYQRDDALGGHSFGNLMLSALTDICGDFELGLEEAAKLLKVKGRVLPSTKEDVHIWAETNSGEKVYGEENIDLGKYNGDHTLQRLHLDPEHAKGYPHAVQALLSADVIIAGPGDLYTSIMPNLLITDIAEAIHQSKARKLFIVNITNKPFETPHYMLTDYMKAVEKHTRKGLFTHYLYNTNQDTPIPKDLDYTYVKNNVKEAEKMGVTLIGVDVVNHDYPLSHNVTKLASEVMRIVQ